MAKSKNLSEADLKEETKKKKPEKEKAPKKEKTTKADKTLQKEEKKKAKARKHLTTLESTQMWSPIKDVKDGVVVTKDGTFVQILEFTPINFNLLPEAEQVAIATTFGSILRTFPPKFQLKILSRKANVETHVRNLRNYMSTETNPRCYEMQMDSIRQIQSEAISGVSRRFFVAFPYEEKAGLRRASWAEITSDLRQKASQIASQLAAEPCNNDLLNATLDNSAHILNILYDCMCRSEAEFKQFDTKVADVVCAHIIEQQYRDDGTTKIPVNDFLAPRRIDRNGFSHIIVDGKYYTFGYIHKNCYNLNQVAGWLSLFVNMGEGVDVDIWAEERDSAEARNLLSYAMQVSENELYHKRSTSADTPNLQKKIQSQKYLLDGLAANQKLFDFSIMLTVVADSLEELKMKWSWVHNRLVTNGYMIRPLHFMHDIAFRASLPICQPPKVITRFARRNILSTDFGSLYPFVSYEINDPNGIRIGINRNNRSPLFLDFYDRYIYSNGNAVFLGSSGSGKTYALLCIALRLRLSQVQTTIIAPYKGHEYIPSCTAIGGTYIYLAPGSEHNINIMEIRRYDRRTNKQLDGVETPSGSLLVTKINQVKTFVKILKPDLTSDENNILEESLFQTYRNIGITRHDKSLEDPKHPGCYKPMPVLGDLDAELAKRKGSSGIRSALAPFITGACKNFNGQTNVNLDNPYVVIDVSDMPKDLMPVAIFIATDFVYDTIRADRLKRKAIFLDELSRMIGMAGSSEAAEFVLTLYKTVRAYNTIVVSATQDTNDFFALSEGKYGKGILANAKIKLILKQEEQESETLGRLLRLSETETQRLTYYNRGEGLLIANRNHVELKVVASQLEDSLITTDSEQLKALLAEDNDARR